MMKLSRKSVVKAAVAIAALAVLAIPATAYASSYGHDNNGHGQHGFNDNTTNGLKTLGDDCDKSRLPPHTGFQVAPACSTTEFGEVAAAAKDPQLLITKAPTEVAVGAAFSLDVSSRNLVRDRFLAAGAGGYYLESSFLNGQGLQRGHFHTACRMLDSLTVAPQPDPVPAFFQATEDGKGSSTPDTVTINVTGMPTAGTAECAVWAGDGSHRLPMMQRANQTPAFDVVRVTVK
jgi:hypothetical protein